MEPVSKNRLIEILEDILQHVKDDDSTEGFLNYLAPELDDGPEVYARVEARYRVGNRDGQGGMKMIGVEVKG